MLRAAENSKAYAVLRRPPGHPSRDPVRSRADNKPDSAIVRRDDGGILVDSHHHPPSLNINPLSSSSVMRVRIEAAIGGLDPREADQAHIIYGRAIRHRRGGHSEDPDAERGVRARADPPEGPRVRDVTVAATFFYTDGANLDLTLRHDGGEPFVLNQRRPTPRPSLTSRWRTSSSATARHGAARARGSQPPEVNRPVDLNPDSLSGRWACHPPRSPGRQVRVSSHVVPERRIDSGGRLGDDRQSAADSRRPGGRRARRCGSCCSSTLAEAGTAPGEDWSSTIHARRGPRTHTPTPAAGRRRNSPGACR